MALLNLDLPLHLEYEIVPLGSRMMYGMLNSFP